MLAEVEIDVPARHAYAILHKPHCTRTADSLILGIPGHTVGLSNRTTNVLSIFIAATVHACGSSAPFENFFVGTSESDVLGSYFCRTAT